MCSLPGAVVAGAALLKRPTRLEAAEVEGTEAPKPPDEEAQLMEQAGMGAIIAIYV